MELKSDLDNDYKYPDVGLFHRQMYRTSVSMFDVT
jgi:hypothetical protein